MSQKQHGYRVLTNQVLASKVLSCLQNMLFAVNTPPARASVPLTTLPRTVRTNTEKTTIGMAACRGASLAIIV